MSCSSWAVRASARSRKHVITRTLNNQAGVNLCLSASVSPSLSLSLSLSSFSLCLSFPATRRLPFVSLLRLGYRISYSASDVHGSQLPRYNVRRLLRFYRRACWEHDEARFARRGFRTRFSKCFLTLDEKRLRKEFQDFLKFCKTRRRCAVLRGDPTIFRWRKSQSIVNQTGWISLSIFSPEHEIDLDKRVYW